ncbi:sulfatase-like hydrolase/transferase [Nioella sp.]|uniref:sulfatase-like hydrolase/transferase n=1 Tax=Nioella sp. TaxID=1912091 RepID=UPI003A86112C
MTKRPNILFITSDQQRGDCYGFAGRNVKTPHLDRLRAQGMHMDRCITPAPVCQPARASILTGKLPKTHGVRDNGVDLRPEVGAESFAAQMGRAGYDTALIGKAHFSTTQTFEAQNTPECKTGSANYPSDWTGPYMGFDHVQLVTQGHWHKFRPPIKPPHGRAYEHWFFHTVAKDEGFELWKDETRPGTGANQTWNSALPPAWHSSTWVADQSLKYLWNRSKEDAPFCLWVSFPDPHHPFDCPEPWSRLHDPEDIDLPEHRESDLDRRPWWHRASLEGDPVLTDPMYIKFREKVTRIPDQTEEQLREMIANTYGMISLIDHNVGRLLSALEEMGVAEDTIVVYTSDHGDHLGDHGLYLKGPIHYDTLLRVGMIVRGPGIEAGSTNSQPVSTLDLGATFCDYAETSLPDDCQSQSLRTLWSGGQQDRACAFCEWDVSASRCGVELDMRTVHTGTAKLTMELNSGDGEMYDLASDPDEMENIWGDPHHAELQRELLDLLENRPGAMLPVFDPAVGVA